jgi:RNA polymerase sigma-70 factor (ECF subfamily)
VACAEAPYLAETVTTTTHIRLGPIMSGPEQVRARLALLTRLAQSRPVDQTAWQEFVTQYGPRIYHWCRRGHLQDADAHDVTQQVLLRLASRLTTFRYDPTRNFHAWLHTLTQNARSDFLSDRRRFGQGAGGGHTPHALAALEARADLLHHLGEVFDLELLESAMAHVSARLEPDTWEAFRLTAVEGVRPEEAALLLRKRTATVYVARSKVLRLLREEVRRLGAVARLGA